MVLQRIEVVASTFGQRSQVGGFDTNDARPLDGQRCISRLCWAEIGYKTVPSLGRPLQ